MRKRYKMKGKTVRVRTGWVDIPPFLASCVMEGDEHAIRQVVVLFEPMICGIARRKYIGVEGTVRYYIDPFVKGYIEGRLMEALVRFPYL